MTRKKDRLRKVLWTIVACMMGILLFCHTYNDILITTRHGINFWKFLFDGQILHFFEQNYVASGNVYYDAVQGCAYNILLYIIFAVWNIPTALLSAFGHVDVMNNIFCIAYMKLLPVLAMFVSMIILRRILVLLEVRGEKLEWMCFLYLSSSLIISSVFVVSQYDILSVVFQLLGVEAFLQKKDKKFVFYFGIAFCLKYFSIVLFLPLLLLRHKRIFSWITALAGMLVPMAVTSLPFVNSYDRLANELSDDLISRLFGFGGSGYSLFVILYCVLLVWCLLQSGEELEGKKVVWAAFAAYGLFFSLLKVYFYWTVMFAPFMVLLIALTPRYLYLNLLLETFGYACQVLSHMLWYHHYFFGDTMKPMLMSRLVSEEVLNYQGSLIHHIILTLAAKDWTFAFCNSVFIAVIAVMLFLGYPVRAQEEAGSWTLDRECREMLVFRCLVTCGICMMPVLSLFI